MQDRITCPGDVGTIPRTVANRWIIAVAAVVMQIALGAVYAWSDSECPRADGLV